MKEYKDVHHNLIDKRLEIDCAMSVAATLTSKEGSPPCTLIGSWTVLRTKVSDVGTWKSETEFLPVIPQPPKNDVCKCYLDFLLNVKNDQNLSNVFSHNDHDIFYKLSQIIWIKKNEGIVNIMGGFHILLVILKIFYRKRNLKGLKECWL